MKRILLVIVSLLAVFPLSAQRFIRTDEFMLLDVGKYSVSYELQYVFDSTKPAEKELDVFRLDIGESWSKSYSYALFCYDSICTERTRKGQDVPGGADTWLFMEVYKDRKNHQMTVSHRAYENGPVFKYQEPSDVLMNWMFSNEICTIWGYRCQKAVCTFRGRTWSAWFTPEIPIPDGPWKFAGLPGLVLKVEDDRGHYAFSCIAIRNEAKPIAMWKCDYKEATREETWEFDQECYRDLYDYALRLDPQAQLLADVEDASGRMVEVEITRGGPYKMPWPYNPLELEYDKKNTKSGYYE